MVKTIDKNRTVAYLPKLDKRIEGINAICLQILENREKALSENQKEISGSNKQVLKVLLEELEEILKKLKNLTKKDPDVTFGRVEWENITGLLKSLDNYLAEYQNSDSFKKDLDALDGIQDTLKRLRAFFLSLRSW